MLPGFISGFYDFDECHIDLARLASLCGVQFICASATGVDPTVSNLFVLITLLPQHTFLHILLLMSCVHEHCIMAGSFTQWTHLFVTQVTWYRLYLPYES